MPNGVCVKRTTMGGTMRSFGLVFAILTVGARAQLVPPPPAQTPNLLAQAAQQLNIRRCGSAISQVAARAVAGTRKHDILVDWDRANPDGGAFFSVMGLEYDSVSALLSLTTVPSAGNRCALLVERISSAPTACKDVVHSELSGYKATQLVRSVTVYTSAAHGRETVTLVDTPPSCLIFRRQVDYNWPAAAVGQ